ncbi:SWI/SNF-related matrix-associated actin-dependent regulator of chromatin subfamily A-like protein [Arachis hypogaea]|nr:SWI/SNF-related matrix-associated actin-dependent regulator of chromatin subfamily A-like protein [Arachis hypogaea]
MLQRNSNMTRGYVFDLEQIPAYSCFIGYVSWQVMDVPAFFLIRSREDAKILAALEYLGTFIEAGCKFHIFAHHQPMIDAIHECLLKKKVGCIWIDGGTPAASRQQLVTDFRYQGSCSMVLSIKAGGVGLTLTAASTVIFTEQSWTPGDLIQAKDRAYRIGQMATTIGHRPSKQRTLDQFVRRCDNVDRSEVGTSA